MGCRDLFCMLLTMALAIGGPAANGSALGTITGPVSGVGSDATGLRESVSLEPVDNLLVGRPAGSMIELIVIDAPDHRGKKSHLMLRELETQNGFLSLLLTAPDALKDRLRRITIYVRGANTNMVLLEQHGNTRERHLPQTIQSTLNTDMPGNLQLLAFPLKKLGLYWISNSNSPVENKSIKLPPEPTASALLGGSISRGLHPWGLSCLLLIVIMSLSHWLHAAEKRRNT